jgi:hypothetical protein
VVGEEDWSIGRVRAGRALSFENLFTIRKVIGVSDLVSGLGSLENCLPLFETHFRRKRI